MQNMIANDYQDSRTLKRRIKNMQKWLKKPVFLDLVKSSNSTLSILMGLWIFGLIILAGMGSFFAGMAG